MIDVTSRKCEAENCLVSPSYNYIGEKVGKFCMTHKKDGMINVKDRICSEEGCLTKAYFNYEGSNIGLWCFSHKKDGMEDVKSKKCQFEGCKKQPSYNYCGKKGGIFCYEHKLDEMINVYSNKCCFKFCSDIAIYGYKDEKATRCEMHKQEDMINLELESLCCFPNCKNFYDIIYEEEKYCLSHCPDERTEITAKRKCKYCDLKENSKFICNECKKIHNKIEWGIIRHIKKNIKVPSIYNSSSMLSGCSKKRPDLFYELTTHCVIVEIDENQHRGYDDRCECSRINEIVNGIGGKPVIFIRFNPDKTRNKGILLNFNLEEKISLLLNVIECEVSKQYYEFKVLVFQLFYDDNYKEYQKVKEEDITDIVCI